VGVVRESGLGPPGSKRRVHGLAAEVRRPTESDGVDLMTPQELADEIMPQVEEAYKDTVLVWRPG
jgi:hypothetical protein